MGNGNSTTSRTRGSQGAPPVASTGPHYVAPKQRKVSTKPDKVPVEEHGHDDETFSNYIQRGRNKIRTISKIGDHEKKSDAAAPVDEVASGTNNNIKENEKDHFSDFIQNAKRKIRTVSRRNSSFRRGK